MTDTFFEIGLEGTSNEDCLYITNIKNKSILVFDKQEIYGTTYKDFKELKSNKFIKNIKVYKHDSKILIETDPKFYRPNDKILNLINNSDSSGFCDFIPIDEHFLILENGKYFRIPYSKTDLVDTTFFTFKDKHLVNRFVKEEVNFLELNSKLSDSCKQILLNGIVGNCSNAEDMVQDYLNNFGGYPYIYPKHGHRDIAELISRVNAVNGISYLLDSSLSVFEFKKLSCYDDQLKFKALKKSLSNAKVNTGTCYQQKPKITEFCHCEDNIDLFDRFNTNNDPDSEEQIDHEVDFTGTVFTSTKHCCQVKQTTILPLCQEQEIDCNDKTVASFNILNNITTCPLPVFFQGAGSKIKVEDITLRNQVINFTTVPNKDVKSLCDNSKFSYDCIKNYIDENYKYFIHSKHGNVFVKRLYKKELTGTKKFVRVINLTVKLIKDRFFAWFYNGSEFLQVLMIDSNSQCCKKGTFLLYIVKNDSEISDRDLKILNIHECHILTDISFQIWDYKHILYE